MIVFNTGLYLLQGVAQEISSEGLSPQKPLIVVPQPSQPPLLTDTHGGGANGENFTIL